MHIYTTYIYKYVYSHIYVSVYAFISLLSLFYVCYSVSACLHLCKLECKFKLQQLTGMVTHVDKTFVFYRDVMRNIMRIFTLFLEFLFLHFLKVILPHRYILMFLSVMCQEKFDVLH